MRDPRVRRTLPLAVVLVVVVVGLLLVATNHWRRGAAMFAAAALLAAILRTVVPSRWIGLLAVRSRAFDVLFLLALSALFAVMVSRP